MSANRPVFEFIIQPEFPMNALILGTEALRIANQNDGKIYCDWHISAADARPVRATNGMNMTADFSFDTAPSADYYLVFGGNLPTQAISEQLLSHIRHAARFGHHVGSVDTGLFALAQAGLLSSEEDSQAVIHWEAAPGFTEKYPEVKLLDQAYLVKGRKMFCAGGVAILDMIIDLLARLVSDTVAEGVANALIFHRHASSTPQKNRFINIETPVNKSDSIAKLMEENLENPLSLAEVANKLNLSVRTLERRSIKNFNLPPMRLYLEIRLRAARNLLFYEEHPVNVIGFLCGFSSQSVFTRSFKTHYKMSPNQFRKNYRKVQLPGPLETR